MLTPCHLRSEYRVNPLGMDTRTPRLSWIVESDVNGLRRDVRLLMVNPTKRSGRRTIIERTDAGP